MNWLGLAQNFDRSDKILKEKRLSEHSPWFTQIQKSVWKNTDPCLPDAGHWWPDSWLDFIGNRTWRTGGWCYLGCSPDKTIGWRTDDGLQVWRIQDWTLRVPMQVGCMPGLICIWRWLLAYWSKLWALSPPLSIFLSACWGKWSWRYLTMYEDGAFGDWLPDDLPGMLMCDQTSGRRYCH